MRGKNGALLPDAKIGRAQSLFYIFRVGSGEKKAFSPIEQGTESARRSLDSRCSISLKRHPEKVFLPTFHSISLALLLRSARGKEGLTSELCRSVSQS